MADFDSLSFALLIPFSICFVLIFIVCCFADEIKDICRMPSPLPSSFTGVERTRRSHRSRGHSRRGSARASMSRTRLAGEDARNLIQHEEGRSRNVSESSGEFSSRQLGTTNITVDIINEQPSPSSSSTSHVTNSVSGSSQCEQSTSQKACSSQFVPQFESPQINCGNFHNNLAIGSKTNTEGKVKSDEKDNKKYSWRTSNVSNSVTINENLSSMSRNMSVPDGLSSLLSIELTRSLSSSRIANIPSTNIVSTPASTEK